MFNIHAPIYVLHGDPQDMSCLLHKQAHPFRVFTLEPTKLGFRSPPTLNTLHTEGVQ